MRKILTFLMLAPVALTAGPELVGTTSAAFVKLGSGSRPASLGEAYVALADDASGISYNPAGMSQMLTSEIQATHTEWFQGLRYENMNAVFSLGDGGMVGATFNFLSIPSLTRTEQINDGPDPALNFVATGEFTPYDMQAALAYSRPLYPGILAGANLKVLSQNIDDRSTLGLGLDLGVMWLTKIKGLSAGASAQNLGTPIKLKHEAFGLPMLLRLGGAYRMLDDKLTFLLEGDIPYDNSIVVAMGVEFEIAGRFYPRLGFRYNNIFNPWSVGLGTKFGSLGLDLAMVPFGELGLTYRASLSYHFGSPKASLDTSKPYLSNSGSGKNLVLHPHVTAPDKVAAWGLFIYDSGRPAKAVFKKSGYGSAPREIVWDGNSNLGGPAPEGKYHAIMSVRYTTGKVVNTKYLDVTVNNSAPQVSLGLDPASVNPRAPGEAYVPTSFKPVLKAGTAAAKWRLQILDPAGAVFRTYSGDGTPPSSLVWDGNSDS
ncbi:MAG: PorV/PorQ family protein, partial [candidate division FCPU426 bacterium]